MFSGALVAVFYAICALLGGLSAICFVLGLRSNS